MKRYQQRRVKGFRKPANSVLCANNGKYNNPFRPSRGYDLETSLKLFEEYLADKPTKWFDDLRGVEYLGCYCSLDKQCHVDILISVAMARWN